MDEILNNAWEIATKGDEKTRLQGLSLANECYKHKMGLFTNGVVIDDALKFVKENKNNIEINDDDGVDTVFESTNNIVFLVNVSNHKLLK